MRVGAFALCLVVTLALASSARGEGELVLARRSPLAVVTITSAGGLAQTRTSALISSLSDLFREHTDLEVTTIEEAIPKICGGALGCMTRRIRTDYDHAALELPNGQVLPFAQHAERVERDRSVPHLMLVVSNFVQAGAPDRVFAMLVDLDRALELHHVADRRLPEWRELSDAKVDEEAVVARTDRVELSGEEDTLRFLERLITVDLQPALAERGHWRPFGALEISGTPAGRTVRIDGDVVGVSSEGRTLVLDISAGPHVLTLEAADGSTRRHDVVVQAGTTERLTIERDVLPSARSGARTALIYGGVGLAAVGVVVTTLALAFGSDSVDRVCFEGGACSSRSAFAGTGEESLGGLVEPSQTGPLLAPLGYSLVLSGGIFSLGTHFLTEEDETPWLPLLIGLAAGGLSYGLSAALGSTP